MSVTISPARSGDYADCKRIVNQKANREGFGFLMRSVFDDYVKRGTKDTRYVLCVLKAGGTVIGFMRALHRLDGQTTLHEICIDSACHGQGHGRQLIAHLKADAKRRTQHTLLVKTPQGIAANAFYKAVGLRLSHAEKAKVRMVNVYKTIL
ncbi:MAG: GNAT family N-acetyltransferase [Proteobacteria bacterium]|nr:GNAT family N-acetyltransferase [Pseudomonadota bacterium]